MNSALFINLLRTGIVIGMLFVFYLLIRYEDEIIAVERRAVRAIRARLRRRRHWLGRLLLKDAPRRPLSESAREKIALAWIAEHDMVFSLRTQREEK